MRRTVLFGAAFALSCAPSAYHPAGAGITHKITESIVAVGIANGAASVVIQPVGDFSVIDQTTGEIKKLRSNERYRVEADENKRVIIGKHLFFGPTRLLPGDPGEHVLINDKKYRGNILFRPNKNATLTVIDEMGIEEYLQGVLPKEMSPNWPMEALKAQAVVARTFALNNMGKFSDSGFDLSDDSFSQMYTGLEDASDKVRRAVRSTEGQVLYWNGSRVDAYFHSTCGGRTVDPASAWGAGFSSRRLPRPLRGVRDRYCRVSPNYDWEAYFKTDDILRKLADNGIHAARLDEIRTAKKDPSGRTVLLDLYLDGRRRTLKAHAFRMWLGPGELKSTRLRRIRKTEKGFRFIGRGYGHGVGLCQWGARVQAEKGRPYTKILRYYFPHAEIHRVEL